VRRIICNGSGGMRWPSARSARWCRGGPQDGLPGLRLLAGDAVLVAVEMAVLAVERVAPLERRHRLRADDEDQRT
jgi:hypothetical protein